VPLLLKRTVVTGGLVLVFSLGIAACLFMIPKPLGPLQYMVAGSVATALTLAVGFAALNWMPKDNKPVVRIRIARKSEGEV
jgi:CBS domain containing-hemolysin-like protein